MRWSPRWRGIGGLYDSSADLWSRFATAGAPGGDAITAYWTGSELIVSDELTGRAWRYDVDDARWTPTFLTLSPACSHR